MSSSIRIYDNRPKNEALAARMKRDRVTGAVRAIVSQRDSIDMFLKGRELVPRSTYQIVTLGVFDEAGEMIAHYATRRDGRIEGARKGDHCWGWMVPQPSKFRLATELDLASLVVAD